MEKTVIESRSGARSQRGFTLIEVMMSMLILTVGLVSLLGVFGLAISSTQESQENMIAKQLADEALENILTARDTAQTSWDQIQNVSMPSGIFLDGYRSIYQAGPDGIFGTADDLAGQYVQIQEPGPDGIYGTGDDVKINLSNYERQIKIEQVFDANKNLVSTLRTINISVRYYVPRSRQPKTYVLSSLISQYR